MSFKGDRVMFGDDRVASSKGLVFAGSVEVILQVGSMYGGSACIPKTEMILVVLDVDDCFFICNPCRRRKEGGAS